MNTVMLVGRLAHDPEVRTTESGKNVVRISVAVNRSFKNPDGVYCKKGDTVGVRGRLQVSHYEKDEQKIKKVDVIVEKLTFLSSKKADE